MGVMDVLALCRMAVGIARFGAASDDASLVVKATLSLAPDGAVELVPDQDPLSLDRPSASGAPHELAYSSDFAPYKPRADVLLVGHARDEAPSAIIAVRFAVGDLVRRAVAIAPRPLDAIPLSDEHLRAQPSRRSAVVSVGPRSPSSPERAALLGGRALDATGAPRGGIDAGLDLAFFNAAPAAQQVDRIPIDARLVLHGLLAGAEHWESRLPGVEPIAFVLGPAGLEPVPLACDTLLVDTDRARCVLVFRGPLPREAIARGRAIVLAERWPGDPLGPARVERELSRARRVRAMEASDLAARAVVPETKRRGLASWMAGARVDDEPSRAPLTDTLTAVRGIGESLPFASAPPPAPDDDDDDPPTPRPGLSLGRGAPLGKTALGARVPQPSDRPQDPRAPREASVSGTFSLDPSANPLRAALPFRESAADLAASDTMSVDPSANPLRAVLPFAPPGHATPPASAPPPAPTPPSEPPPSERTRTVLVAGLVPSAPALPFETSARAPDPQRPLEPMAAGTHSMQPSSQDAWPFRRADSTPAVEPSWAPAAPSAPPVAPLKSDAMAPSSAESSPEMRKHGARMARLWGVGPKDVELPDGYTLRAEHEKLRAHIARDARAGRADAALALLAAIRTAQRGA